MDHESRVHDADAVPSARVNAEDASPRDEAPPAGQDAVPTRYTAPIRHAVPAAPPAYALEHARQNSGEPEPSPQPPQPKKQGAVRQALRAATKSKTAEPQVPQDAPAPRFIPASTPEPPAPSSSEVSAASKPAPSQTSQEVEQDVSPRRNSIPHQAYTPKNPDRAFSQMQAGLETINARRRSLNITIGVRLAVLALLGIFEGAIIARYTTKYGVGVLADYHNLRRCSGMAVSASAQRRFGRIRIFRVGNIFADLLYRCWTSTFTHHIPTSRLELGWYFTGS